MEIQPNEEELWQLVLEEYNSRPGEQIRIRPLSDRLGMHPQRARQLVRTWKNRGWVDFSVSAEKFYVIEDRPITDLRDD